MCEKMQVKKMDGGGRSSEASSINVRWFPIHSSNAKVITKHFPPIEYFSSYSSTRFIGLFLCLLLEIFLKILL